MPTALPIEVNHQYCLVSVVSWFLQVSWSQKSLRGRGQMASSGKERLTCWEQQKYTDHAMSSLGRLIKRKYSLCLWCSQKSNPGWDRTWEAVCHVPDFLALWFKCPSPAPPPRPLYPLHTQRLHPLPSPSRFLVPSMVAGTGALNDDVLVGSTDERTNK